MNICAIARTALRASAKLSGELLRLGTCTEPPGKNLAASSRSLVARLYCMLTRLFILSGGDAIGLFSTSRKKSRWKQKKPGDTENAGRCRNGVTSSAALAFRS